MIEIFYKKDGHMMVSQSETDLNTVSYSDVVWIDLFAPSGEEKRAVEHFLGTVIQNRAQAEEIEISSSSMRRRRLYLRIRASSFPDRTNIMRRPCPSYLQTRSLPPCVNVL